MFGKEKKQKELLDSLEVIFMAVAQVDPPCPRVQISSILGLHHMKMQLSLLLHYCTASAFQPRALLSICTVTCIFLQEHGISPGDFPDAPTYKEKLIRWAGTGRTLANLPKLNKELVKKCYALLLEFVCFPPAFANLLSTTLIYIHCCALKKKK